MKKTYLGDGVYFDFDGYHVILTTENGIETTNRICLDPDVLQAFAAAADRLRAELEANLKKS